MISMMIALSGYVEGDGLLSSLDSGMHVHTEQKAHACTGVCIKVSDEACCLYMYLF